MGSITRLFKESGIYGFSSILARMLNFLFTPLYTRELTKAEYGQYSEVFAYIGLLQVVLTFGLETGFFRFASRNDRDPKLVFSTLLHSLAFTSVGFFALTYMLSDSIAQIMSYSAIGVVYLGAVLALDSYTSILFARLRFEHKAVQFAILKSIKIAAEIVFNLMFFLLMPKYFAQHPDSFLLRFLTPEPSYLYILAAVTCSSLLSLITFIPQIFRTAFSFSMTYLKEILLFSLPLMVAQLQGASNDLVDRVLFRFFSPRGQDWLELLGVFSANTKLAVIMILFVQMFRYAAEPFFFSLASHSDSKQVNARVMRYFTIFCVAIFLFVCLNQDLFLYILGENFRVSKAIVPLMLLSNLLLGINQNLSMWYKLSGKTKMALPITFVGLVVTMVVIMVFMPLYGIYAAAVAHLLSYMAMLVISWQLSKSYYLIPYQWADIWMYIFIGLGLYLLSLPWVPMHLILRLAIGVVLLAAFVLFVIKYEHINVKELALELRLKLDSVWM